MLEGVTQQNWFTKKKKYINLNINIKCNNTKFIYVSRITKYLLKNVVIFDYRLFFLIRIQVSSYYMLIGSAGL